VTLNGPPPPNKGSGRWGLLWPTNRSVRQSVSQSGSQSVISDTYSESKTEGTATSQRVTLLQSFLNTLQMVAIYLGTRSFPKTKKDHHHHSGVGKGLDKLEPTRYLSYRDPPN